MYSNKSHRDVAKFFLKNTSNFTEFYQFSEIVLWVRGGGGGGILPEFVCCDIFCRSCQDLRTMDQRRVKVCISGKVSSLGFQ